MKYLIVRTVFQIAIIVSSMFKVECLCFLTRTDGVTKYGGFHAFPDDFRFIVDYLDKDDNLAFFVKEYLNGNFDYRGER